MSTSTEKRSRTEAIRDAEAFRALFDPSCYEQWHFAGSVRRERQYVGDVEHVIIPRHGDVSDGSHLFATPKRVNLLLHRLDELERTYAVSKHQYGGANGAATTTRWGERYRGCDFRGFNHEVFLADADNLGSVLAIRTGPGGYSRMLVMALSRNGYKNADGYVWHTASGDRVPAPDEETYFKLCGVRFIPPAERFDPEARP